LEWLVRTHHIHHTFGIIATRLPIEEGVKRICYVSWLYYRNFTQMQLQANYKKILIPIYATCTLQP
ncbi:MAG: hypothetical protein M3Z08_22270, partial [Chloroflexota bacterium]|nr:hypothetical protein [Chloroflexota bacterium]